MVGVARPATAAKRIAARIFMRASIYSVVGTFHATTYSVNADVNAPPPVAMQNPAPALDLS
jgi:hypothetical protein